MPTTRHSDIAARQLANRLSRTPPVRWTGFLVAGVIVACACGSDHEAVESTPANVYDSAGVRIVQNWSGPKHECVKVDTQPSVEIRTRLAGSDTVPPLFRVRGVTQLPGGRIAALNAGTDQLLFFSANGQLLRSTGRSGDGPGEFRKPSWMGHAIRDTLWVWDDGLLRLSAFDLDGNFLAAQRVVDPDADRLPLSVRGRFADGSFLLLPGPVVWVGERQGLSRSSLAYKRYDPATGQTTDLTAGLSMEIVIDDRAAYVRPFGRREIAVPVGEAFVVGDNGFPRLKYFDMSGRLFRIVEWKAAAEIVTAADKEAYLHRAQTRLTTSGSVRFPSHQPVFSSIMSDTRGRVWVRDFTTPEQGPRGWLVFSPEGQLRCRVKMPGELAVWEIGQDHMVGVRVDSLGEESIVSFRVSVLSEFW